MKVTKEQLDKVRVALTIEVSDDKFEEAVEKAYIENIGKIRVDGFRKGHAPRKIVEKVYGKEVFFPDAVEFAIPQAYYEAVMELKDEMTIIAPPEYEVVQLEAGKPFIFKATVDTKQDIALGEYKGIALEKIEEEVTDEELNKYLDEVRAKHAEMDVVTDPEAVVENGDRVLMDFCGKKDGVAFEGGTAENYTLDIGSNSFIPGFEIQMLGMKVGEERALNLNFPENYHEASLAGQPVVFEVKVHEIKRKTLAPLDDEFAKDVSEFDTLDEYKASVLADLSKQKKEAVENQYKAQIANKVTEDSDVIAPESLVKKETENFMNELRYNFSRQGFTLEQYLELTGGKLEDVEKDARTRAESFVKQRLVMEAIAEKEGIEVADDELDKEYERLAEIYKQPVDTVKQMFTMQGQTQAIKTNVLLDKTMDMLLENAQIG